VQCEKLANPFCVCKKGLGSNNLVRIDESCLDPGSWEETFRGFSIEFGLGLVFGPRLASLELEDGNLVLSRPRQTVDGPTYELPFQLHREGNFVEKLAGQA